MLLGYIALLLVHCIHLTALDWVLSGLALIRYKYWQDHVKILWWTTQYGQRYNLLFAIDYNRRICDLLQHANESLQNSIYERSLPRRSGHFAKICDILGFLKISQLIYKIYAFLIYQSIARNVGYLWVTLTLHLNVYVGRHWVFPGLNWPEIN